MLEGLKKAVEIIEQEIKVAKGYQMPVMVMGMSQVEMLIKNEIKKIESEDK